MTGTELLNRSVMKRLHAYGIRGHDYETIRDQVRDNDLNDSEIVWDALTDLLDAWDAPDQDAYQRLAGLICKIEQQYGVPHRYTIDTDGVNYNYDIDE